MSFYVTLSSNSNRDVYPHNHGGNFTIELGNTINLNSGNWEVALVEFWYVGQRFANVPQDETRVDVRGATERQFANDYIVTADQTPALFIQVEGILKSSKGTYGRGGESKSYGSIQFEEHHYNQHAFEKQVAIACTAWRHKHFDIPGEIVSLEYKDNVFTIKITVQLHKRLKFTFSPALVSLLSLSQSDEHFGPYSTESSYYDDRMLYIVKPAIIQDKSELLLSPSHTPNFLRTNKELVFNLPSDFWTYNTLSRFIHGKVREYNASVPATKQFTLEIGSGYIKYDLGNVKSLEWSSSLAQVFGNQIITSSQRDTTSTTLQASNNSTTFLTETSFLQLLYYKNMDELVTDLNQIIKTNSDEIAIKRNINPDLQSIPSFMVLHYDDYSTVSFVHSSDLQVHLTPGLLNILGFPIAGAGAARTVDGGWLTETQHGTLKNSLRVTQYPYFFVYADCILGHMFDSGESNLIKVIDNDAAINEHKHISFPTPQYFPTTRSYINSININIKSDANDEAENLIFNTETRVTLHFKCPFT